MPHRRQGGSSINSICSNGLQNIKAFARLSVRFEVNAFVNGRFAYMLRSIWNVRSISSLDL